MWAKGRWSGLNGNFRARCRVETCLDLGRCPLMSNYIDFEADASDDDDDLMGAPGGYDDMDEEAEELLASVRTADVPAWVEKERAAARPGGDMNARVDWEDDAAELREIDTNSASFYAQANRDIFGDDDNATGGENVSPNTNRGRRKRKASATARPSASASHADVPRGKRPKSGKDERRSRSCSVQSNPSRGRLNSSTTPLRRGAFVAFSSDELQPLPHARDGDIEEQSQASTSAPAQLDLPDFAGGETLATARITSLFDAQNVLQAPGMSGAALYEHLKYFLEWLGLPMDDRGDDAVASDPNRRGYDSLFAQYAILERLFPGDPYLGVSTVDFLGNYYQMRVLLLRRVASSLRADDFVGGEPERERCHVACDRAFGLVRSLTEARKALCTAQTCAKPIYTSAYAAPVGVCYRKDDTAGMSQFQLALHVVMEICMERCYVHDDDVFYAPRRDASGQFLHCYERVGDVIDVVHGMVGDPRYDEVAMILTAKDNLIDKVSAFIARSRGSVPVLECNRRYWCFRNGVFDSVNTEPIQFGPDATGITGHFYFDCDMPDIPAEVLGSPFFNHGIDPRDPDYFPSPGDAQYEEMKRPSPHDWLRRFREDVPEFLKILEHQVPEMPTAEQRAAGEKPQEYHVHDSDTLLRWILFFLGRSMQPMSSDDYQKTFVAIGEGGTGKSLLLEVVRGCFSRDRVMLFAAAGQKVFGLEGIDSAYIWQIPELRAGFSMSVTDWLSLCTGEPLVIRRKFRSPKAEAVQAHGLSMGNEFPTEFKNKKQSVSRRLALIYFLRRVTDVDTQLSNALRRKTPLILFYLSIAYRAGKEWMENQGIRDVADAWHYVFDRNLRHMETENSPLIAFLSSPLVHVHDSDEKCPHKSDRLCHIPVSDFKRALREFCQESGKRYEWIESEALSVLKRRGITQALRQRGTYPGATFRAAQEVMANASKQARTNDWLRGISFTELYWDRLLDKRNNIITADRDMSAAPVGEEEDMDDSAHEQKAQAQLLGGGRGKKGGAGPDADADTDKPPPIPPYILKRRSKTGKSQNRRHKAEFALQPIPLDVLDDLMDSADLGDLSDGEVEELSRRRRGVATAKRSRVPRPTNTTLAKLSAVFDEFFSTSSSSRGKPMYKLKKPFPAVYNSFFVPLHKMLIWTRNDGGHAKQPRVWKDALQKYHIARKKLEDFQQSESENDEDEAES